MSNDRNLSPLARLELQKRYRSEQTVIETVGNIEQAFEAAVNVFRTALAIKKHAAQEQAWALEKLLNPDWEPQVTGVTGTPTPKYAGSAQATVDAVAQSVSQADDYGREF